MKLAKLLFVLTFLLTFALSISAQNSSIERLKSVPSEEKFEPDDDLISSSVGLGKRTVFDVSEQDTIRIYNADGSIWYEFSYHKNNPLYFQKNKNPEFKPYRLSNIDGSPTIFRIKAKSENWFQVVINEDKQLTKYTLIKDPLLGRWSFERFIHGSVKITFDREENPLRETPNGEVKKVDVSDTDIFISRQIKGDWLLVKVSEKDISGWIRWRKERDLLIGYIFNNWVIPLS